MAAAPQHQPSRVIEIKRPSATPRETTLAHRDSLGENVSPVGSARTVAFPNAAPAILVVRRVDSRLGHHGRGQLVDGAAVSGRLVRKE
jgi:hypothetical protein